MSVQFSLNTSNTALTWDYGQLKKKVEAEEHKQWEERGQNKPGGTNASLLYRQRKNEVKGKADVWLMRL